MCLWARPGTAAPPQGWINTDSVKTFKFCVNKTKEGETSMKRKMQTLDSTCEEIKRIKTVTIKSLIDLNIFFNKHYICNNTYQTLKRMNAKCVLNCSHNNKVMRRAPQFMQHLFKYTSTKYHNCYYVSIITTNADWGSGHKVKYIWHQHPQTRGHLRSTHHEPSVQYEAGSYRTVLHPAGW